MIGKVIVKSSEGSGDPDFLELVGDIIEEHGAYLSNGSVEGIEVDSDSTSIVLMVQTNEINKTSQTHNIGICGLLDHPDNWEKNCPNPGLLK